MSALVANWLLPPLNVFLILVAGVVASRWRRRLGTALLVAGLALLYVSSAPFLAEATMRALEPATPSPLQTAGAGAIVLLGGGSYVEAPEYGSDTPGPLSLERARYAARLHRTSGLPILVSGGPASQARLSEAEQLRDFLEQDLNTPVRWLEPAAMSTWENARYTERVLRAERIRTVVLVTHAWHMRRALVSFRAAGLEAIPAPVGFLTHQPKGMPDVLPSARAMMLTHIAWREALGLAWYKLRYRFNPSNKRNGA
jgi:uncharacterized SAM-binding protein YcdF (DUF218 family)